MQTIETAAADAASVTTKVGNAALPAMPSVKLDQINARTTVSTDVGKGKLRDTLPPMDYQPRLSVELAESDEKGLVRQPRAHYVGEFKRGIEKTARSTLETCRVVYEASRMLDSYEFQNFCKEIGYRDSSSTIRKFIAIGKVYPRFIQYAEQLPGSWTNIYQITQIPADHFEEMLKNGQRLDQLKGSRLQTLIGNTRPLNDLCEPLKFDNDVGGFAFARMVSMKKFDDVDWRAIEKAMSELEARLPIKFVVPKELLNIVEQRRLRRYQSAKKHFTHQEFKPDTWDMGEEANRTLPREEPTPVNAKK